MPNYPLNGNIPLNYLPNFNSDSLKHLYLSSSSYNIGINSSINEINLALSPHRNYDLIYTYPNFVKCFMSLPLYIKFILSGIPLVITVCIFEAIYYSIKSFISFIKSVPSGYPNACPLSFILNPDSEKSTSLSGNNGNGGNEKNNNDDDDNNKNNKGKGIATAEDFAKEDLELFLKCLERFFAVIDRLHTEGFTNDDIADAASEIEEIAHIVSDIPHP